MAALSSIPLVHYSKKFVDILLEGLRDLATLVELNRTREGYRKNWFKLPRRAGDDFWGVEQYGLMIQRGERVRWRKIARMVSVGLLPHIAGCLTGRDYRDDEWY